MGKKVLAVLKVLAVSYVITGLLLLLAAFLMLKLKLGEAEVRLIIMVIYGIASIAAGLIFGKIKGSKRMFNGALIGLLYFGILFLISLIANKGFSGELQKNVISLIICIAGGTIGGIIS
ncbi:MAG: TIGR04086 family membrane protein [Butyrivibrio sp.]